MEKPICIIDWKLNNVAIMTHIRYCKPRTDEIIAIPDQFIRGKKINSPK